MTNEGIEAGRPDDDEIAAQLKRSMAKLKCSQAHLDEVVAAAMDTHRRLIKRLDAFIAKLERYISEDRNGGAGG